MTTTLKKVFDSATHPTLNGLWTNGRRGQTFAELSDSYKGLANYRVLAIGLPNVGGYEHASYKSECDNHGFEAVAALTSVEGPNIRTQVEAVANLGFRAIKIHPRLLKENRDLTYLSEVFEMCVQHNLVCLLCTYESDQPGNLPASDPFYQICDALNHNPEVRLILMHGGGSRLQQFSGLARHSETILLDLSYTMMLQTFSLESDIFALASQIDQRICIGSDSPEYPPQAFLNRANLLFGELASQKLYNIMFNNLNRFFPKQ